MCLKWHFISRQSDCSLITFHADIGSQIQILSFGMGDTHLLIGRLVVLLQFAKAKVSLSKTPKPELLYDAFIGAWRRNRKQSGILKSVRMNVQSLKIAWKSLTDLTQNQITQRNHRLRFSDKLWILFAITFVVQSQIADLASLSSEFCATKVAFFVPVRSPW